MTTIRVGDLVEWRLLPGVVHRVAQIAERQPPYRHEPRALLVPFCTPYGTTFWAPTTELVVRDEVFTPA